MNSKLSFILLFLFSSIKFVFCSTPEQKIDSLQNLLKKNLTDSIKLEVYGQLFNYYSDRDQMKSSRIIQEVFKLGKQKKFLIAEGEAFNMLGIHKKNLGESDSAIFYHDKAETIFRKEKNFRRLAYCLMNAGNNIKRKGDLKLATEKFKEAIEISRKIKDKDLLASNLLNLGLVEHEQNNLNLVFTYYFEALKLFEELKSNKKYAICCINISNLFSDQKKYDESNKYLMYGKEKAGNNPRLLGAIYGNIANNYMQLEQFEKSIEYYKLALSESEKSENLNSAALCHSNLGLLYSRIKQFDVAISHLKLAEKEFIQEDSKSDLAELYRSYGVAYKEWGKYNEAILYFNKTLSLSKEFNFPSIEQFCLLELSRAYYKLADYKNAYNYAEKYIILNDSIANAQSIEKMLEVQTKYETEKKELEIKNLQGEKKLKNIELEKSSLEIKKQNQQKIFFAVGFVLIGVLAIFIFKTLREKQKANTIITQQKLEVEKQKDIVEEQHKEITDSINYAQRIQQAMLPSNLDLEKIIPNSFVLLLPKNVVSGDFYWFTKQNDFVFYVTADCTGHGVPGGFMSMLGISLLNQIVNEKKIIEPAEILNSLKSSVISSLKQSGNSGESRDGMDLCLCRIDTTNNNLTYAAANNSLYLVSENTITEYKGDKQPIGYHNGEESSFTQHTIQLQKNDLIYTTTDGYPDQFGGEKGKKFRYKNFENLLLEISVLAIQDQHTTIKSKFYEWKKDFEQTDDVCVIGIKI